MRCSEFLFFKNFNFALSVIFFFFWQNFDTETVTDLIRHLLLSFFSIGLNNIVSFYFQISILVNYSFLLFRIWQFFGKKKNYLRGQFFCALFLLNESEEIFLHTFSIRILLYYSYLLFYIFWVSTKRFQKIVFQFFKKLCFVFL